MGRFKNRMTMLGAAAWLAASPVFGSGGWTESNLSNWLRDSGPVVKSGSQQFLVHDARQGASPKSFEVPQGKVVVQLSPESLAVSLERTRDALLEELGIRPNVVTPVYVVLKRAESFHQEIVIVSARYYDGWRYHLVIPDQVDPHKVVRACVNVLLQEIATRGVGGNQPDLPLWVTEGLTRQLLMRTGGELVVNAAPGVGWMRRINYEMKGADTLTEARKKLAKADYVSFEALTKPEPWLLRDEQLELFQSASQILVMELLKLPEGVPNFLRFLRIMPACWNWQTAFSSAYSARFPNALDAEKWWSLIYVQMTQRNPAGVWSSEVVLGKLDELLMTAADVRLSTNELPLQADIPLERVIQNWKREWQDAVLEQKIGRLRNLRANAPLHLVTLIDGYRECLADYLQQRDQIRLEAENKLLARTVEDLMGRTLRRLAELDAQREVLRILPVGEVQAAAAKSNRR